MSRNSKEEVQTFPTSLEKGASLRYISSLMGGVSSQKEGFSQEEGERPLRKEPPSLLDEQDITDINWLYRTFRCTRRA